MGQYSEQDGHRRPRAIAVTTAVALAVVAGTFAAAASPSTSAPTTSTSDTAIGARSGVGALVPYQYIAKAYTELLGRAPAAAEWTAATSYFQAHGCDRSSLELYGDTVVASAEYRGDYSSTGTGSIALTLYRFVLNREPDATDFVALRDRLATVSARTGADGLFDSTEFATRTEPAICSLTEPGYSFGEPGDLLGHPAIQTPASGAPGADSAEATLQEELDRLGQRGGGTLTLPLREVVGLTTTLTVPSNVTLTTAGGPDAHRYADMARLVRLPSFTGTPGNAGSELVGLRSGARLIHIWVDGQRYGPDPNSFADYNVEMAGGIGTTVEFDRIGNSYGATNVEDDVAPPTAGDPTGCRDNVVSHNLVEGYSSAHFQAPGSQDHTQTDGLGIYCGSTAVEGNVIVDISDAAIVLFDGGGPQPLVPAQLSLVADNTIISAGNSMYYAIVTDPFWSLGSASTPGGGSPGVVSRAFATESASAVIRGNRIWTGDRSHFDVLLNSGTHDLFGSTIHQNCLLPDAAGRAACGGGRNATGATWIGNTSDGLLSRAEMGIYVGGTEGARFRHNSFPHLGRVTGGTCPRGAVIAATGSGPASDFAPGLRIDAPVTPDTMLRSDLCIVPSF